MRTPRGRDIMAACGQLKSESVRERASVRHAQMRSAELARRSLEVAGDDPSVLANAAHALADFGERLKQAVPGSAGRIGDDEFALWLAPRLEAEGYAVYADILRLDPGSHWRKELTTELQNRAVKMLLCCKNETLAANGVQEEIAFAQSQKEIQASVRPPQLAFALHAYVQEANWAFKLFNDKSAFLLARRAIADRIAAASGKQILNHSKR